MDVQSITTEAIRIATTAGLSKDVIDLLTSKVSLLSDEISSLTTQLTLARSRVGELGAENADLQKRLSDLQLQSANPADRRLNGDTDKILKFYYDSSEPVAIDWVAAQLGIHPSEAAAHASDLYELGFIGLAAIRDSPVYTIDSKGTKYVMKHLR